MSSQQGGDAPRELRPSEKRIEDSKSVHPCFIFIGSLSLLCQLVQERQVDIQDMFYIQFYIQLVRRDSVKLYFLCINKERVKNERKEDPAHPFYAKMGTQRRHWNKMLSKGESADKCAVLDAIYAENNDGVAAKFNRMKLVDLLRRATGLGNVQDVYEHILKLPVPWTYPGGTYVIDSAFLDVQSNLPATEASSSPRVSSPSLHSDAFDWLMSSPPMSSPSVVPSCYPATGSTEAALPPSVSSSPLQSRDCDADEWPQPSDESRAGQCDDLPPSPPSPDRQRHRTYADESRNSSRHSPLAEHSSSAFKPLVFEINSEHQDLWVILPQEDHPV